MILNLIQIICQVYKFAHHYFSRTYLTAMHFNENSHRMQATNSQGLPSFSIRYRRFKKMEATVRKEKVKPTYSKYICRNGFDWLSVYRASKNICRKHGPVGMQVCEKRHTSKYALIQHAGTGSIFRLQIFSFCFDWFPKFQTYKIQIPAMHILQLPYLHCSICISFRIHQKTHEVPLPRLQEEQETTDGIN